MSGNGNHAEQTTESLKPTLKLTEHIQIGVDFDGSNDTLIGKYDEYRTLIMVLKQDVSWGLDMIFSCTCWDKSLRYENGRPRSHPDANDWHYGQTNNFYINGVNTTNAPVNQYHIIQTYRTRSFYGMSFTYRLSNDIYSRRFSGKISEIIAFDRQLNSTERIQIDNYLKEKWGL